MVRVAWKAQILPGRVEEYVKRHDELWPELKDVFRRAGIRNYSIWNVGTELFGYYECDDMEYAGKVQNESPDVQRWNEYMKDVMVVNIDPVTGTQPQLRRVFLFEK